MKSQCLKNKLLFFLFLTLLFIIPTITLAYSKEVYVGGENIGISVNSSGVLVVGFYDVGSLSPGKESGLKIGDRITKINNTSINDVDELSQLISDSSSILITYIRNNKEYTTTLNLKKNKSNIYKTGLYVKDNIIGIGTLTFIDPITMTFGALGHEITEKTTRSKFEIEDGTIFKSTITNINKSTRNNPGEKNAIFESKTIYGTIEKNTISGIYGTYSLDTANKTLYKVAASDEIVLGEATFKTVIKGNTIQDFNINILKINKSSETKNILFEIIDDELLQKTNGIVQGMSGSPIIQNGKIIGAVTHVVVDNPIKGYAIFISTMLEEIEN